MPTPSTRPLRRSPLTVALVAVVAAALVLAGCGDDGDESSETTEATSTTAPTATTGGSDEPAEPVGEGERVGVYFVRDEKVAAAAAEVDAVEPAAGALEALLGGAAGADGGDDMTSAVPEGTELLGIDIAEGVATVDLSAEFAGGGGSLSMQLRAAQVVFTLTQFDSVDEVTFLIDGQEVEGLGGEGIPANGVDRADFSNVTPLVLVTSPLPGEQVGSPLLVEGLSNTFEATVLYEVLGSDGAVLADGFTTATAGSGTWGDFSVEVDLEGAAPGEGVVVAYQEDMESGGRQDVYEVPVALG